MGMQKIEIWDVDLERLEKEVKEWKGRALKAEIDNERMKRVLKQRKYARNYYYILKKQEKDGKDYNRGRSEKEITKRKLNTAYYCNGRYAHISEYLAAQKIERLKKQERAIDQYVPPYKCNDCKFWHIEKPDNKEIT